MLLNSAMWFYLFVHFALVLFDSVFFETEGLYTPGWPQTHDLPSSATQVLGLQMCTTTLGYVFFSTGARIQGLYLEPLHQPLYCDGLFWARGSWSICLGWPQTSIILISASWIAGITGVSHWCLAWLGCFFFFNSLCITESGEQDFIEYT
jgi:hypothetical protein